MVKSIKKTNRFKKINIEDLEAILKLTKVERIKNLDLEVIIK